jgi:hypothetical protein
MDFEIWMVGRSKRPFFSRGVLQYFTQTWRNNSFRCLLWPLPRPQDVGYLCLRYCRFFNLFYNLNCSAWERAPWRRVTEKSHFSTLNLGLTGTGNQTRATCMAGSIDRRSALHYASKTSFILNTSVVTQEVEIVIMRPHSRSEITFAMVSALWNFLSRPLVWVSHWIYKLHQWRIMALNFLQCLKYFLKVI